MGDQCLRYLKPVRPQPQLATLLSQEFGMDKLLSKMLAKAPSQRLSSAKEVSQALKEIQKALIHERTRSQAPNLQRISFYAEKFATGTR